MTSKKGHHSSPSHFSETNVKLAEKKEFAIYFVQKCLEMRGNEQNVVSNKIRKHSETALILWIAMRMACDHGASRNSLVREACSKLKAFFYAILETN